MICIIVKNIPEMNKKSKYLLLPVFSDIEISTTHGAVLWLVHFNLSYRYFVNLFEENYEARIRSNKIRSFLGPVPQRLFLNRLILFNYKGFWRNPNVVVKHILKTWKSTFTKYESPMWQIFPVFHRRYVSSGYFLANVHSYVYLLFFS